MSAEWRNSKLTSEQRASIQSGFNLLNESACHMLPPSQEDNFLSNSCTILGIDFLELTQKSAKQARSTINTSFRRCVRAAHPDIGGNGADFQKLIEARNELRRWFEKHVA